MQIRPAQARSLEATQAAVRALLAAVVDGTPPRIPAGMGGPDVVALARHHRLSPLLPKTAVAELEPAVAQAFRSDRLYTVARSLQLRRVLRTLLEAFTGAAVRVAVVKGAAHDELLYAGARIRPAGDIDLLVPLAQRRAAFEVLAKLGFRPVATSPGYDEPDYHEVGFARDGASLDLHFGLVPFARFRIDYAAVWAGMRPLTIDGAATLTLAAEVAIVHQALHMSSDHFDVPALYLVDLHRMCLVQDALARARVLARAWRCERPLRTALALARSFLPAHASTVLGDAPGTLPAHVGRVVRGYGGLRPVPRAEQLRRKVEQFDRPADAARYLAVQGRRILRERALALFRPRLTPEERLGLTGDYR